MNPAPSQFSERLKRKIAITLVVFIALVAYSLFSLLTTSSIDQLRKERVSYQGKILSLTPDVNYSGSTAKISFVLPDGTEAKFFSTVTRKSAVGKVGDVTEILFDPKSEAPPLVAAEYEDGRVVSGTISIFGLVVLTILAVRYRSLISQWLTTRRGREANREAIWR